MKPHLIIIALSILVLVAWFLLRENMPQQTTEDFLPGKSVIEESSPAPGSEIPISPFFNHYGTEAQAPSTDLANVAKALAHFWLLIKDPDALSVMSNQTIMHSLLGNNPHGLRLIAANHPFLNPKGELLDRWKTPLAFHPNSLTDIEIRSAGPDKKLHTEDDLVHSGRAR